MTVRPVITDRLRDIRANQPLKRVELFTVVGLPEDATKVIVDDGAGYRTIPCLDGYRNRAAGDLVVAAQLSGNDWVVLGKIGADDSPVYTVTQGSGAPSGGYWRHTAAAWVADHMDGTRSIYFDMTGAAPAPAVVASTDAITWDGSSPSREVLEVAGTKLAVWYYRGDVIYDACFGKTATAMFLRVTRAEDDTPTRPMPLRMAMHGGLIAAPSATNYWTPGILLVPGQTVLVPIPALYLSVIADGTVGGFLAYANPDDAAMRLEPEADLQIHFG